MERLKQKEKRPKILIHSLIFSPDSVSTAYLYKDIALAFYNKGYAVKVLTTTPHYNVLQAEVKKQPLKKVAWGLYYKSNLQGIPVIHIPQKKFKSTPLRIMGFIYWHLFSLILGLREKNVSVILSPSPPLTIGFINLIIGRVKHAKVVYNVQEIYPDFLIEQTGLKFKPAISFLKGLERLIYNKSSAITTIDQLFYNRIVNRMDAPAKLHIIPNFVDTELYHPLKKENICLDDKRFPRKDTLKLMYAGNIGYAQDWDPLLTVAEILRNEPIEFYIIGEGVRKEYVLRKAMQCNLDNVHVLPYQSREKMPHLIAFSDLQFIFMSKEMENLGFPSKVYTIMACAKPMIVCSGENTPIVNFLKKYKCAKIITLNNPSEKVNAITAFLKDCSKGRLETMGKCGFDAVISNYSKEIVTNGYINLIKSFFDK